MKILRIILFIPVFICVHLLLGYLINNFIYPSIQWIAGFIINGLTSEFPESRLPDSIVWLMIIFRVGGSALLFFISAYLSIKVYPHQNKRSIIYILISINIIMTACLLIYANYAFPQISLLTLNNVLILIGSVIGYIWCLVFEEFE